MPRSGPATTETQQDGDDVLRTLLSPCPHLGSLFQCRIFLLAYICVRLRIWED